MCLFSPEKLTKNYVTLQRHMTTEAHPRSLQVPTVYLCTQLDRSVGNAGAATRNGNATTLLLSSKTSRCVSLRALPTQTPRFQTSPAAQPKGSPAAPAPPITAPRSHPLPPAGRSDAGLGARKYISFLSPMLRCAVPSLHRINPLPASPRRKGAPSRSSSTAALGA